MDGFSRRGIIPLVNKRNHCCPRQQPLNKIEHGLRLRSLREKDGILVIENELLFQEKGWIIHIEERHLEQVPSFGNQDSMEF